MKVAILDESAQKERLQQRVLILSFLNLLVVALLGLLLRGTPFLSSFPLSYKNLLHGHSHFAFGGWVIPVLMAVVMMHFPLLKAKIFYRHWRNIAWLFLLSAYGMLVAFPLQGYKAVSISFSTLSVAATVYYAIVVWKASKQLAPTPSLRFLKWGLFYGVLSALGPFALGQLMVTGQSGSPLYFDAIYFYLHFQYNGFFVFTVLALLYQRMEKRKDTATTGHRVFYLLNAACVPAYALSVLWHQPSVVFNGIGALAAGLQVAAIVYLLKYVVHNRRVQSSALIRFSLAALVLKSVLQLFSALPAIAAIAYQQRNFVIAYLHLVLLGCITVFVFALTLRENAFSRWGVRAFLFSFLSTEVLLVLNAFSGLLTFSLPFYPPALFLCSVFFPVGIGLMIAGLQSGKKHREGAGQKNVFPAAAVS